ncbi:uncharacterized protein Dmoj_GI10665 [Drosophila mojavensis]|uniref:Attacin C-terminal domain-containing protein n=1 Tax=Drosophila mojavensis TaxID=7230 RepID=B4K9L1_DROMO|nr:uncharacterized protein Dmoj_GI10665 [Drosophila mojavensis]
MRAATFVLSFAILACFVVRRSEAVACTSLDPDVPAAAATTTLASTGTGTGNRNGARTVFIRNLRYTNVRRIRRNNNANNNANNNNANRPQNILYRRGNARRGYVRRGNVRRGNVPNVRVIRV